MTNLFSYSKLSDETQNDIKLTGLDSTVLMLYNTILMS